MSRMDIVCCLQCSTTPEAGKSLREHRTSSRSTTDSRDRLHRQESRAPFTTDLRIVGRSDAGRGRSAATRGSFAGLSSSASAAISSTLGKESACSAVSGVLRGSVSSITRFHDICKHSSTVHVANNTSKLCSMSKLAWAGAMWKRDGTQC